MAATFALNSYTVTASAGANGTIAPPTQTVAHGGTTNFTVTPSAGYTATMGGTCPAGSLVGTTYTTGVITADCTVTASFTQVTFTVTPSAGANGTITPSTPQTVASGATTTFTVTPNAGYAAVVGGTCGGNLVGTTYTTNPITANCTVAASFTQNTYTVTPSAGANGSITPSGAVNVTCGDDQSFTIAADACYSIADVLVDGVSVGAVASYSFNDVAANHTIDASFVIDTYVITASAGPNGTITPSGAINVNCGDDQSFTITPDACYSIADLLVDGVPGGQHNSHMIWVQES